MYYLTESVLTIKSFTASNICSTSVVLSWSVDTINKPNAIFKVWYGSENMESFTSDIVVATITNLKNETLYTFTIQVEIPADENYNVTVGTPNILRVNTSKY